MHLKKSRCANPKTDPYQKQNERGTNSLGLRKNDQMDSNGCSDIKRKDFIFFLKKHTQSPLISSIGLKKKICRRFIIDSEHRGILLLITVIGPLQHSLQGALCLLYGHQGSPVTLRLVKPLGGRCRFLLGCFGFYGEFG